jgi:hypothetical protein
MQRLDNGTQAVTPPAFAGSGAPGFPAAGAVWDPYTCHMMIEEILAVVTAAGIAPSSTVLNQLLAAIQSLIAAGSNALLQDFGVANAYVLTPTIAIESYANGYTVVFKAANANTGASTINVSAVGAVAIVHRDGTPLQAADIPAGSVCRGVFVGGVCQLEDAIPTLATAGLEGLVKLATSAQTQAGTNATAAVTPAALATVLPSGSLGETGFIAQPLAGGAGTRIEMWGPIPSTADGAEADIVFPNGGFPNNCFNVSVTTNNPGGESANAGFQVLDGSITQAGFTAFLQNFAGAGGPAQTGSWRAIGN